MSGYYKIVEAQKPLVLGLGGHDLLAVLNPAGDVVMEFDGLATSASGATKAIGYLPSDWLQVKEFGAGGYFYERSFSQALVVSSTTLAGLQPYINAMTTCASDINAEHLSYPFLGLGTNSNSVASTLDACMGEKEPFIPNSAPITPGVGTLVLPAATIDGVQKANGLTQLSTTGDNAVTGESTGSTTSTVDVSNGEGITSVATLGELTTHSGAVDGNDILTEKNSTGTTLVTETNIITSTGAETLEGTGTAANPVRFASTDGQVDIGGSTYADVYGTGNSIFAKGVTNSFTNVGLDGTNEVISGSQNLISVLNSGNALTNDSTSSSITAGGTIDDNFSLDGAFDTAAGLGTGTTVNLNASDDGATLVTGDTINLASSISLDKITGGIGDTANLGNGTDADFIGSDFKINLGTSDNINSDGTGNVISVKSGDVVDLPTDLAVTIDGSGATIVANKGDTIDITGTSDKTYADSSTIEITGADTGDVVYGQSDSGDRSDWGGYVDQGGGYGGYGGGGYYDAKVASTRPGSLRGSVASSTIVRAGLADIAEIGATDQRFGMDRSDPFPIRASVTVQKPAGVRSPQGMVDQLIHAMATWPASAASSMFNPTDDTVDAASIHFLAKSSPVSRALVDSHTHPA